MNSPSKNPETTRTSLGYKLKHALQTLARAVLTTDPFVTTDPSLQPLDSVIAGSDLLILCAPHSAYRDADLASKPVVDISGFLKAPMSFISDEANSAAFDPLAQPK